MLRVRDFFGFRIFMFRASEPRILRSSGFKRLHSVWSSLGLSKDLRYSLRLHVPI